VSIIAQQFHVFFSFLFFLLFFWHQEFTDTHHQQNALVHNHQQLMATNQVIIDGQQGYLDCSSGVMLYYL